MFPVGKKENGEGGIDFDNEDEKEQWEEDQRVRAFLLFSTNSKHWIMILVGLAKKKV